MAIETIQQSNYTGYSHVTWYVSNARQAASYMITRMGFEQVAYRGLETGSRSIAAHVVGNGAVRFVFISVLRSETRMEKGHENDIELVREINDHIKKHGDGVKDVAFVVNDLDALFKSAVENGAQIVKPPYVLEDESGYVRQAVVQTYGDTTHTLVEYIDRKTGQPTYRGDFLPGYSSPRPESKDPINLILPVVSLVRIDHCVGNQDKNQMEDVCKYYERALGFRRFWSVDDSQVHTEYSALRSVVMSSGGPDVIKMPINETAPGKKRSQIEEFVEYYDGPGVQHIALLTEDIVAAVSSMKTHRGVGFIAVPHAYYEMLALRLAEKGVGVDESDELVSPSVSSPSVSSLTSSRSAGDVESLATNVSVTSTSSDNEDDGISNTQLGMLHIKDAAIEVENVNVATTGAANSAATSLEIRAPEISHLSFAEKRLEIPYSYAIPQSLKMLEDLGILVDFDENGYLLQTFTRPLGDRPTVFIEIIQRMNHNGFGAGNFRALFEAIERDQSARGNL